MASVTKRNNTYTIRVSLGYDSSGKQIQKFKTWKPPYGMTPKQIEKELERQKFLFEEQCRSGQYMDGNIKFSEFADIWLKDYAEKQLRPQTLTVYIDLLKQINKAIGHIKVNNIQPHHLMEFYNNLREENVRRDAKYSAKIDAAELLHKKKLTHQALADLSGVSTKAVQSFVKGVNIAEKSAVKIANGLNMPVDQLFNKHFSNGSTLAPSTISKYHRLISSILEKAVKWQVILYNPCQRVEAPKVQTKEKSYLDEVHTAELIKYLDNEPLQYKTIITTLLYSGMRRGELCGLEWSDIDFKNDLININKSSLYTVEKGIYNDTTKTESSKRIIKVPPLVIELLKQHKKEQTTERLKQGDLWIDSGKIFTQWNGKPIHPDTISGWFRRFLKKYDLPSITIHSLRHTNATLLIAGGTDLRTVSKRLGHANMSTTANIYTHAIQSADERAAQLLDDMLSAKRPAQNS